jgi:hypothetical protein
LIVSVVVVRSVSCPGDLKLAGRLGAGARAVSRSESRKPVPDRNGIYGGVGTEHVRDQACIQSNTQPYN